MNESDYMFSDFEKEILLTSTEAKEYKLIASSYLENEEIDADYVEFDKQYEAL